MINKLSIKQILPFTVGLLIINVILSFILWKSDTTGAYHLDGSYSEAGSSEILKGTIMGMLVSFPVLCLILGAITALFINKGLPYGKRYWKAFLLTLTLVYGLFVVGGIFKLFMLMA